MPTTRSAEPKYRRRRQMAGALSIALVVLLVAIGGYVYYVREVAATRDYDGTGNGTVVMVRVDQGDSVASLTQELLDRKIIGSRGAMLQAAEESEHSGSGGLHAGYYPLQEKMSAKAVMDTLTDESKRRGVVDIPNGLPLDDVRVVGGDTREGVLTLISRQTCEGTGDRATDATCVTPEELSDTIAQTSPEELGVPAWAVKPVSARGDDPRRIEGLIAPGVHLFDPTSEPKQIIHDIVASSAETYEGTGLERSAQSLGLTPYQVITAASLIEREAPEGDFDKVARVILNRLHENKKLEFDSTVNYSVDEQEVATTDEDRARRTPWNTYAKEGLPDTPIASPGLQALHAMENPADGDWLYFVTVDKDGTTVFNRDFSEHEKAIEQSRQGGVLDSGR
ncbi:endolytic transglycosylase MltG [Corynebacterium bovis]|uniref:Endolytic murein transglycosylase n=1 Tax=Corynebacterium bovis DSM 20582 = CIP 54.80 TaxID=927655 RepID=A0A8H9YCH4_9CORY|nr:endolytic transglycosylase MltG [Corynebacterium bovis]MBB3116471.1 UPF0755 protein [Corynebacterium bovis DSM 20582 = CIP 54.80]QQC47754.1 endolytic transglycosylase MltG [Corynebacterium bovis]RRO80497.1 endolytic transglycosylase MltG [Corynebacterium bovis]RRO89488.1 endolytic transglycosylase MltG [Corynebacterium bovis]RRO96057.1 endolytic transglycosylase MltG [Corynebacterium bovis]